MYSSFIDGLIIAVLFIQWIKMTKLKNQVEDLKNQVNQINRLPKLQEGLDKKVDRSEDVEISENVYDEINRLINRGEKIKAIKALREETGMSLVDAKESIDRWSGDYL